MASPLLRYTIGDHALGQLKRRGIDILDVRAVLAHPEQRFRQSSRREVLQSRAEVAGKEYLIRVFVDLGMDPSEIVTAYRTSRISKYWRRSDEGAI